MVPLTEQYFSPYIFSQLSNMADINNDGMLDAWSCHDVGLSEPYLQHRRRVMVEDGSMIQQTVTAGGNYATVFTDDYDEDGDPGPVLQQVPHWRAHPAMHSASTCSIETMGMELGPKQALPGGK
ncbi:MAG: hypothetical protein IPL52_10745 [Flavobacteriales bacterium]|nr:hypothetical protein [Flavobacteriales bacterium]